MEKPRRGLIQGDSLNGASGLPMREVPVHASAPICRKEGHSSEWQRTASDQASGCGGRWSPGALFTHLPSVLRREKGAYLQESNSLILPRHQPKTPVFRVASENPKNRLSWRLAA